MNFFLKKDFSSLWVWTVDMRSKSCNLKDIKQSDYSVFASLFFSLQSIRVAHLMFLCLFQTYKRLHNKLLTFLLFLVLSVV